MKRSEFVNKLEDYMYFKGTNLLVDPEDEPTANEILQFIESLGMLPPETGKGYPIVTVNPTGTHDHGTSKDNRWEPENE